MLDEIYTYVGAKARKHYIFTAYGLTDLGYVIRYGAVFEHNNARSLELFLRQLPTARAYFADGAPMYGMLLGPKVLQEKSAITNLVESFNAQLRQCLTGLRRKTKAYAKRADGLRRQLALAIQHHQWRVPVKIDNVLVNK